MLEECEAYLGQNLNIPARPSRLVFYQGAAAVRGLLNFDMHEPLSNRRWLHAFARFLSGHAYTKAFGGRIIK